MYLSTSFFFLLAFIYLLIYFWRQGMFVCIAPLICRVKEKVLTAKTNEQVKKNCKGASVVQNKHFVMTWLSYMLFCTFISNILYMNVKITLSQMMM